MKHHWNARITQRYFLAITTVLLSTVAGTAATPSTLVLSSSINPSVQGQSITLTAKVTPGGATGKVTFYDGSTILGTRTVAGGQAALITTLLPFGSRSLKAHYEGDATYQPSTAPVLTQAVNAVPGFGFARPVAYSGGSGYRGAAIADFDGDGRADIVVWLGSVGQSVNVLLGNGDGTFQTPIPTPRNHIIFSAVPADFNGDGRMDLLVEEYIVNNQSWEYTLLAGRGDGTFDSTVIPNLAGGEVLSWAVGDFNGDGFADVAAARAGLSPTLNVLLGNGDGTFQNSSFSVATQSFGAMAVNDFDGDGKADLAIAGQPFSVFLGNGDARFRRP